MNENTINRPYNLSYFDICLSFKAFHFIFTFYKFCITEQLLHPENSTSWHGRYFPIFNWHRFCGDLLCLKLSELYRVWWWRYCVLEGKLGVWLPDPHSDGLFVILLIGNYRGNWQTQDISRWFPFKQSSIAVLVSKRDQFTLLPDMCRYHHGESWRTGVYLPHIFCTNILTTIKKNL